MANEITVNPAELRRYAEEIGKCHAVYQTNIATAKERIDSLQRVWTGAAADTFNAGFKQLHTKSLEGLDTLKRMTNALYDSAQTYETNEKAVQSEASKLPKLPQNKMR